MTAALYSPYSVADFVACSASASLPRQPPPHPLLDCWRQPGPIVGIATLTEGFRLRRVRMNDRSEFPQTDASRHRHTDFTDHLPSMARHDGRPEDCIAPLPDVHFHETLLLTIQDGAVHLLEIAHVGVHCHATLTPVMLVQPNGAHAGAGGGTTGHADATETHAS